MGKKQSTNWWRISEPSKVPQVFTLHIRPGGVMLRRNWTNRIMWTETTVLVALLEHIVASTYFFQHTLAVSIQCVAPCRKHPWDWSLVSTKCAVFVQLAPTKQLIWSFKLKPWNIDIAELHIGNHIESNWIISPKIWGEQNHQKENPSLPRDGRSIT